MDTVQYSQIAHSELPLSFESALKTNVLIYITSHRLMKSTDIAHNVNYYHPKQEKFLSSLTQHQSLRSLMNSLYFTNRTVLQL